MSLQLKPIRSIRNTEVVAVKSHLGVPGKFKLLKLKVLRSIGNTTVVISYSSYYYGHRCFMTFPHPTFYKN